MKRITQVSKVVAPIDFSENSHIIAESAAFFAGTFKASLSLVFIVQNFEDYSGFFVPQMNMPNIEHELFEGAQDRMKIFVEEHEKSFLDLGVSAIHSEVLMGDVAEQIVQYATDLPGDLIIMGTHGYKGLEKIMFGSVAGKVVRAAPCSVMTINPYTCCNEE